MTWRVAQSLETLLAEINAAAPNRSKISDGSIGDAAHATRSSDHNPWVTLNGVGIVRARDFTHDPANGCDGHEIAEQVRLLGVDNHPALSDGAYVIWNRRIASESFGWVWRTYSGSNPHTQHVHVSVALAAAGFDSTAPWGVMEVEDDMADYAEQLNRIERQNKTILERLSDGAVIRTRLRSIDRDLDKLIAAVGDDATRAQVRRVREDIAKLAADDA
jgi:hypothetical protein